MSRSRGKVSDFPHDTHPHSSTSSAPSPLPHIPWSSVSRQTAATSFAPGRPDISATMPAKKIEKRGQGGTRLAAQLGNREVSWVRGLDVEASPVPRLIA